MCSYRKWQDELGDAITNLEASINHEIAKLFGDEQFRTKVADVSLVLYSVFAADVLKIFWAYKVIIMLY